MCVCLACCLASSFQAMFVILVWSDIGYWLLDMGFFPCFFVGLVHAHRASVAQPIAMCPFCIVFAFVFGFVFVAFVAFVLISWTIDSWVSFLWVSCQSLCPSPSLFLSLPVFDSVFVLLLLLLQFLVSFLLHFNKIFIKYTK